MSVNQKMGERIRLARKQSGMTQGELAKKLGKTGAAIAYLEQGKRRISTEILTNVARLTSKPFSFFYEDEDSSEQQMKSKLTDLRNHLDGIKGLLDYAEKEKKEAELKLQLFRKIIDQSNDGIVIWDPETGNALDVNQSVLKDMKYTRAEFLKKKIMDIETGIPNLTAWKACVKDAMKKKEGFLIHTNALTKEGKIYESEVSVKYVTIGSEGYIIVFIRNVTLRKEQEAKIAEQIKQNKMLMEKKALGFFMSDLHGNISEVNSVIWDVLKISPENRDEKDFSFIQNMFKKVGIQKIIKDSLDAFEEVTKIVQFTPEAGKPFPLSFRIVPIKYLGYVTGVQGFVEAIKA